MDLAWGIMGALSADKSRRRLEGEFAEFLGARHIFLLSSGKAALYVILEAMKAMRPERRKVLIPAYTCFSVPSAVVKAGLRVSACDISPRTFDFDFTLLEKEIDENKDTLCVIATHLFGMPADIARLKSICAKRDVFLVEDASQAFGVEAGGKMLGASGDAGFFSLGRGKHLSCGSGGVIVTNSDEMAAAIGERCRRLEKPRGAEVAVFFAKAAAIALFLRPSLYWLPAGLPFLNLGKTFFCREFPVKSFSGFQAGLLRGWRRKLDEVNEARRSNAVYFGARLNMQNQNPCAGIPLLRLPVLAETGESRDRILRRPEARDLGLSPMYPSPVNEIEEIRHMFEGKAYPNARAVSERLLSVPTHRFLSDGDRLRISRLLGGPADPLHRASMAPGAPMAAPAPMAAAAPLDKKTWATKASR